MNTTPSVRVTKAHYDVEGATRNAILGSIEAKGPQREGERFVAYTTWKVDVQYELARQKNGLTALEKPHVRIVGHVILPRWRPPAGAPRELRERIRKSFSAIEKHESEHLALGLEAAQRALAALRSVRPSARLDRSSVDALVNREIDLIKKKEIEHDRATHHGLKQGTSI